jgi:hypothetical protein
MESGHKNRTKTEFALALARGVPPAEWACDNGISRMTAYRWAKQPDIRKIVEAFRRQRIDDAVGLLTEQTTMAAKVIADLAQTATSDYVRLRAARSILLELITTSKYTDLERRMTGIEENLEARDQQNSGNGWSPASTTNNGLAVSSAAKPRGTSIALGAG